MKEKMNYLLMHQNIPVMELAINMTTGWIQQCGTVFSEEHIPVGVNCQKGAVNREALNEWWADRNFPQDREGVSQMLDKIHVFNSKIMLLKCRALSLSDQYWIKEIHSDLSWKEINFFDNSFSEDIGDLLLGNSKKESDFDLCSPDSTCDGYLVKKWGINQGKCCLLKAGTLPFRQQPFNEAMASAVMNALKINCVNYEVIFLNDMPYSVCKNFITPETELVGAWSIIHIKKKPNNISYYRHYINCCEELGIKNITQKINEMIVIDYLIANEDRHMNNFGLVRNVGTLQWLGTAPVFDSGSSFGYEKNTGLIRLGRNIKCKPFKKTHEEQLDLVTSFDFIAFDALRKSQEELKEILSQSRGIISQERQEAILSAFEKRILFLERKACAFHHKIIDNLSDDLTENIAENYQK